MPSASPSESPTQKGLLHFSDCSGHGDAQERTFKGTIDLLGRIPAGVINAKIDVKSTVDIDLILLDSSTSKTDDDPDAILSYIDQKTRDMGISTALMKGAGYQVKEYYGRNYSWSGYNGVNGDNGHEVIQIREKANRALELYIYGYVGKRELRG